MIPVGVLGAADPALSDAADSITTYLTDNLPTILGVVVAFVLAGVTVSFIRGLRGKAKV